MLHNVKQLCIVLPRQLAWTPRQARVADATKLYHKLAGLALCMAAGGLLSVALGQDANWDLLNYHFYNGFAILNGRFASDLLPTGMQSYLNPLLDALNAGLALGPLRHAPRVLAAITGFWYGMIIFLTARLAMLLYPDRVHAAAAATLAATGAATISQIGSTTEELQVATLMLAGLAVMLNGAALQRLAVAGLLFGAAAGLKLTSAAYGPAAMLTAMSLHGDRQFLRRLSTAGAVFSCGWIVGIILADGWWAAMLIERFGSPTFPMFNGLFRSPLYPPASVIDGRFFPHSAWQWLFYPLYWSVQPAALVSELPLRDPRLAVALCLALASLLKPLREPAPRAVLILFGVGYAAWLTTSSVLRYAVILEVAGGLLAPLLLTRLLRPILKTKFLRAAVLATTVVIVAATRYPFTLRVPYGTDVLRADTGEIPANTLLVMTFRAPVSYLVPMLLQQGGLQVVNVGNTVLEARGWGLHDRMVRLIQQHVGPIRVLTAGDPGGTFPELSEVGLSPKVENCHGIYSNFAAAGAATAQLCIATRAPLRALPSQFWAQAALRYRTLVQIGDASQSLIGAAYLLSAGPSSRGTRIMDWTDLLWSGVGSVHTSLPERLDAESLYVLPQTSLLAAAERLDRAHDLLAQIDGFLVLAPGWQTCNFCAAVTAPVPLPVSQGADR